MNSNIVLTNETDNNIKIKNKRLYISIILTAAIIYIKNCYISSIPTYSLAVVYLFFFMILKREEKIAYYFFLIPSNNNTLLYIVNVMFFAILMINDIKEKRIIKNNKIDKCYLLTFIIIIYEGFHAIISLTYGYQESIIKFLGFSMMFFLLTYMIKRDYNKETIRLILISWVAGIALLALGIYVVQIRATGNPFLRLGVPLQVGVFKGKVLYHDSNLIGCFCITAVACNLVLYRLYRKNSYFFGSIIAMFIGLLTGSRAYILVFCIFMVLNLLINKNDSKKINIPKTIRIIVIIVLVISFFIYSGLAEQIFSVYTSRLEEDDFSGGRLNIYEKYFNFLKAEPLFSIVGVGLQSYPEKMQMISGIYYSMAHNSVIEIIVSWGIIGMSFLGLYFKSIFKDILSKFKISLRDKMKIFLPMFMFFLGSISIMFLLGYYYTFQMVMLAALTAKQFVMEKKEEQDINKIE